ncbi:hypothetical protein [Corynebacterium aquilae]|uniref:Uncharacterized protein n=1 Tax=Corynebacterium aquilae DSM 44791 TaxID=1431546 RepID=A0A1L7CHJ6_9CORY|nr:hypothetical protein [Corynebacterium aquilae]APT85330.1 hypothetical protein CAQU_09935 [Corynebacterium aquilae DSM 44791]
MRITLEKDLINQIHGQPQRERMAKDVFLANVLSIAFTAYIAIRLDEHIPLLISTAALWLAAWHVYQNRQDNQLQKIGLLVVIGKILAIAGGRDISITLKDEEE